MHDSSDICCVCLSSKKNLKDLHVTHKEGLVYYDILIACLPEMFDFLESNNTFRQICPSCCNIVDVVFKLYQNYVRSKTILLDHIRKLHEKIVNNKDTYNYSVQNHIVIENGDIKVETIEVEDDTDDIISIKEDDDESERVQDETASITKEECSLTIEDDNEELVTCEHFIIIEEDSANKGNIKDAVETELPSEIDPKSLLKIDSETPLPTDSAFVHLNLTCIACNKNFPTEQKLEIHKKLTCSYRDNLGRGRPLKYDKNLPFTCKFCRRDFNSLNALVVHERIHSGGLPYLCELCNRRFRQASNYNYHMKKCHGENSITKKQKKENNKTRRKEKDLRCKKH